MVTGPEYNPNIPETWLWRCSCGATIRPSQHPDSTTWVDESGCNGFWAGMGQGSHNHGPVEGPEIDWDRERVTWDPMARQHAATAAGKVTW